jgi:hypothetical protein
VALSEGHNFAGCRGACRHTVDCFFYTILLQIRSGPHQAPPELVAAPARSMVTFPVRHCDRSKNANPIAYRIEPEDASRAAVFNRWRRLCPGCFDVEAEKAGVR